MLQTTGNPILDDWDPPIPLGPPPPPPFPVHNLPPVLANLVPALAAATQTPPDLPALLALATISAATLGRFHLNLGRPAAEPAVLYAAVALDPGHATQDVLHHLLAPIRDLERSAQIELVAEDASADVLRDLLLRQGPPRAIGVISSRPAALQALLDGGRRAALDQLIAGFHASPIRYRHLHNSPTVQPAITLGLVLPPAALQAALSSPAVAASGLPSRLLIAAPPSILGHRSADPPALPPEPIAHYNSALSTLLTTALGHQQPVILQLSAAARQRLHHFQAQLEPRLAPQADLADLAQWAAHLPAQVARLAALLHLIATQDQPARCPSPALLQISEDHVASACHIAHYAIHHATALLRPAGLDPQADAQHLQRAIARSQLACFTRRHLWRVARRRFKHIEDFDAALRVLLEHGYIRVLPTDFEQEKLAGRPQGPSFICNPLPEPALLSPKTASSPPWPHPTATPPLTNATSSP